MKLIQLSDFHLVTPGCLLFGSDPLKRLEACIADINAQHADADLVIISGDMTNDGEPEAYAALAELLPAIRAPYRMMMGNHDDRAAFAAAFPDVGMAGGFMQSAVDLPDGRIVLLDTLDEGHVPGKLCDARLAWLDGALAGAQDAFVFMHHPAFALGIPSLDDSRLSDAGALHEIFMRHGNVRHIFAGHVHRAASGSWHGIPFSTMRSTNHQSALKLHGAYEISHERPTYGVILADGDTVAVHWHEFPLNE